MNPESFPTPEEFDKATAYARLEAVIDGLKEGIEKSGQEISGEDEDFYNNVLNTADAIVRERSVVTREDFIESLKYRKNSGSIAEVERKFIEENSQ